MNEHYIHGSSATERDRLALMNRLINPACLQALGLGREKHVLDVGAGTGIFTRLMAENLPADSKIIAVEIDPEQVRVAKEQAPVAGDRCSIDFRLGDAADLPLKPDEWGTMDLAHTRYLLEHVRDPLSVVRAMVAAVRPGGRIVILDDDHELLRLWPEPRGVMDAWTAYYRSYANFGTDALVGRKLSGLLHEAGARPGRITQLFYGASSGSEQFPDFIDNLAGQLIGARGAVLSGGQISADAYDEGIENFIRFKNRPDAALWYVINWAEGRVPV